MFKFLERCEDYGKLPLRLAVGALFLFTGITKAMDFKGVVGFLTMKGFPLAKFMAGLLTVGEIAGGLMLVLGLLTRIGAAILSIILIVALAKVHAAQLGTQQAIEFYKVLTLLGTTLSLILLGPGKPSLDDWLAWE